MRAILLQDPAVVMVGEIRDEETAEIAVRAALVGRLALSTIHTNDPVSAIDRLHDLGVPRYLIAATLRGVLSQRLVRRIHQDRGRTGCETCGGTGRSGRQAVSELLTVTPALADAIARGEGGATLQALAEAEGYVPLETDGRSLIASGLIKSHDFEAII